MYAARHAREHPDRPAVIMASTGETITFAEYEQRCNRVAHLHARRRAPAGRPHLGAHGEQPPHARDRRGGGADRCVFHPGQRLPGSRRSGLHRQQLPVAVVFHLGRQARRRRSRPLRPARPLERLFMVGLDGPLRSVGALRGGRRGLARRPGAGRDGSGPPCCTRPGRPASPRASSGRFRMWPPTPPLPGHGVAQVPLRLPGGHDLPQPGAAVPLRPAGQRGHGPAPGRYGGDHGAFRPRAVAATGRALPGDALPDGADHVQPSAPPARRGPATLRPLLAGGDRARRRPLPDPGQASHDRMARPHHH